MSLPLRRKGDRYPLWVVVDEVGANLHKTSCYRKDPSPRGKVDFAKQKTVEARFGICNILLPTTSSASSLGTFPSRGRLDIN